MSSCQLPLEIISAIIDYIGLSHSNRYAYQNRLLLPLLKVNSTWRRATRTKLYCNIVFNSTKSSNGAVFSEAPGYKEIAQTPCPEYLLDLARAVNIAISEEELCNGIGILRNICKAQQGPVFRYANTLHLTIFHQNKQDSTLNAASVEEFVQRIQGMLPNISKVTIEMGTMSLQIPRRVANIADALFGLFSDIAHPSLALLYSKYSINVYYPLANLNICWSAETRCCEKLIQSNASTLRALEVHFSGNKGFDDMWSIFGRQNNIVYPALTKLHLNNHMRNWTNEKSSLNIALGYAPLPALEYLETSGNIAITDDVFFRGNEKTLSHVNLSFLEQSLSVLTSVFSESNRSRLEFAKFKMKTMDIFSKEYFKANPAFDALIRCLPCSIKTLCFKGKPVPAILGTGKGLSRFKHLQLLRIDDVSLTLQEVCKLLSAVPNLRRLHVQGLSVENAFSGVENDQVVEALRREHKMSDTRINFIYMRTKTSYSGLFNARRDQATKCEMILTALYPKLKLLYK